MRYLLPALALFFAACDAAPTAETTGAANVSLLGAWSMHMVPTDRVLTAIPPACDGTMNVAQDDGATLAGTWACGAGAGDLSGFRVHESGGAWVGFSAPSPVSSTPDRWLTAWVTIASARLTGDDLTATR